MVGAFFAFPLLQRVLAIEVSGILFIGQAVS